VSKGDFAMHGRLIRLVEELVHARPVTEDEARATLEWIAAKERKDLDVLVAERLGDRGQEADGSASARGGSFAEAGEPPVHARG
jgi:hypothetical protein